MSTLLSPPCRGCQKRHMGCHTTCSGEGSYQQWKAERDKLLKDAYAKMNVDKSLDAYECDRARKVKRRNHRIKNKTQRGI